jgi:hypothetical protein
MNFVTTSDESVAYILNPSKHRIYHHIEQPQLVASNNRNNDVTTMKQLVRIHQSLYRMVRPFESLIHPIALHRHHRSIIDLLFTLEQDRVELLRGLSQPGTVHSSPFHPSKTTIEEIRDKTQL